MDNESGQGQNKGFLEEALKDFISLNQNFTAYKMNPIEVGFLKLVFDCNHSLLGVFKFCESDALIDLCFTIEGVLTKILRKEKEFTPIVEKIIESSFLKLEELLILSIEGKISDDYKRALIQLNNIDNEKIEVELNDVKSVVINKEVVKQEVIKQIEKIKKPSENSTENVVKVNIQLLDKIMNIIGELVVNRNQILQFAQKIEHPELLKLSSQLDSITIDLQNDIMNTRMQPVGTVLSKFERLVRDLSQKQNKKINFKISGQDTALDKTLLEAIKDPLTHLLRNAIDHGIESTEDRLISGKSEVGSLSVNAFHEGGMVNIVIKDDGKGLNSDKIIAKAISKKLISEIESKKLTEKEIIQFIFTPGFSTVEIVTDVSGRGVGMDVVRTNIEKIGGSIEIETVQGKGATFILKIPLTLAIIPALIFRAKGHFFSIPEINLSEFLLVKEDQKNLLITEVQGASFFRLRGKLIPLFNINDYFKLNEMNSVYEGGKNNVYQPMNIIVISSDGVEFGILVDEIVKLEEVVVKPICQSIKNLEVYSGAAILGNGEVALILDATAFIKKQGLTHSVKSLGLKNDRSDHEMILDESNSIEYLVFSLFDDVSYTIPLSLVNRLEDLSIEDLEKSEDHYLLRYRDVAMPLIHLQKEISPHSPDLIQSLESLKNKKARVLVMSFMSHLVGVVVNDILSTVKSKAEVDQFSVERHEILGTINLNDKTVTLLNLKYILDRKFKLKLFKKEIDSLRSNDDEKNVVLVVENKMRRIMCQEFLEYEGVNVMAFSMLDDANIFIKNNATQIRMVLIDAEVKEFTIHKFAQVIRDNGFSSDLPIIGLIGGGFELKKDVPKDSAVDSYVNMYSKEILLDVVLKSTGIIRDDNNHRQLNEVFDNDSHFCGIRIDKEFFAIPLKNVQEVLRPQRISTIPLAAGCLQGLINLRGQIIPYIKLREILRLETVDRTSEKVNIILRQGESLVSISADEIFDVFDVDQDFLSEVPESIEDKRKNYLTSVYQMPNKLVSILNIEEIINHILV